MAWIGIAGPNEHLFSTLGLEADTPPGRHAPPDLSCADSLLARGTILVEATLSPDRRPQTLIGFNRDHPWCSSLSLNTLPGGGVALVLTQGTDVIHATLPDRLPARGETVRITYAWDAPARHGRLSVEHPSSGRIFLTDVEAPKPIPLSDLRLLVHDPAWTEPGGEITLLAISTTPEPIGPQPTLRPDVPIATPGGYRPAGSLRTGDLVRTMTGQSVPVLDVLHRTVPASGSFAPVRLRAPYFGLRRDIVVAPDQHLVIGGSDVEYTFGRERVLVPARHLVNGTSALNERSGPTTRYVQVLLPGHEVLIAAGAPAESLFIGRLRRKRALLAASVLHRYPRAYLPEHAQSAYRVLKPYEAMTLAAQRAA